MIRFIYLTVEDLAPEAREYPFSIRAFAAASDLKGYSFCICNLSINSSLAHAGLEKVNNGDIIVVVPSTGPLTLFASFIESIKSKCNECEILIAGKSGLKHSSFWASQGYTTLLSQSPDSFINTISALEQGLPISQVGGVAYRHCKSITRTAEPAIHDSWIEDLKLHRWEDERAIKSANIVTSYPRIDRNDPLDLKANTSIIRSAESIVHELRNLLEICRPSTINFVDAEFGDSEERIRAIVEFLKGNFEGVWSAGLPITFASYHRELLDEMARSGLYKIVLTPYSASDGWLLETGANYTSESIERDITTLIDAGILSISLNFSFGVPGERFEMLGETTAFGLRQLELYPGRVEVWVMPFDPFGFKRANEPQMLGDFIQKFCEDLSQERGRSEKSDKGGLSAIQLSSEMGSFQSEILKSYIRLIYKMPYEVAILHLDLDKFGATSAWNEALLNISYIQTYAKAYAKFQNVLITYPLPDQDEILACYPTRIVDTFSYTEDENVILKLLPNVISVLDETSSYIFKLCSGVLTGREITEYVIDNYNVSEENYNKVLGEVANFLVSLEKLFIVVLTKAPQL